MAAHSAHHLDPERPSATINSYLILVSSFAALGGFLYGYDMALMGGVLLKLHEQLHTSGPHEAWIVGAAKAGAVLGTYLGGAAMYKYGRRATIGRNCVFFVAGPLLMSAAAGVAQLVAGRLVIGLGIGVSAVVIPAYLGEMAPPALRGLVVASYEGMLCIGMLAAILVDAILDDVPGSWRWMVGAPVVPGLLLALAPYILAESPRWLIMRGDMDGALAALHRVYRERVQGDNDGGTAKAEQELLLLWSAVQRDHAEARVPDQSNSAQTELSSAAPVDSFTSSTAVEQPLKSNPFHNGTLDDAVATPPQDVIGAEPGGEDAVAGMLCAAQSLAPFPDPDPSQSPHTCADAHSYGPRLCEPGDAQSEQGRWRSCCPRLVWRWRASLGPEHEPLASAPAAQGEERYSSDRSFFSVLGTTIADSTRVFGSPERAAAVIAVLLAFFNQIAASTSIINYAPEVFERVGVTRDKSALMYSALIAAAKTVGSFGGMALVDVSGRRTLLLWGSVACGSAMLGLCLALQVTSVWLTALCMCLYILAFSISWAGVFWVLCSELFSMRRKSAAMSLATAALFTSGAVADFTFPIVVDVLGGWAFAMFGALSYCGGVYVWWAVPETKGLTLLQVQAVLQQK